MAQYVGKAPQIKVDWEWPDEWELVRYDKASGSPICRRPAGDRPGKKEPLFDERGEPVFRVNNKGEKLARRWRYSQAEPELVIGRRSPRGHIWWQKYVEETAEEKAQRERGAKVAAMQEELAGAMVDLGLSPVELLQRLAGAAPDVEDDFEDELDPNDEWPKHIATSWWMLSNGEKVQGEANARAAQAELDGEAPPG